MSFSGFLNTGNYNNNITAYPQSQLHRGTNYLSMFDTVLLPYNARYNNCRNDLCYTQSKGTFICNRL